MVKIDVLERRYLDASEFTPAAVEAVLPQLVERLPKGHVMTVPATRFALEKIGRPLPGAAMLAGFASITGGLKLESIQQAYMARYPGKVGEANGAVAELAYQHIQQQLAQFKENC